MRIRRAVLSLLIGAEAAVIADLTGIFTGKQFPVALFLLVFALAALAAFFCKAGAGALGRLAAWTAAAGLAVLLVSAGALVLFAKSSGYESPDNGKTALFAGKSVLIVAPHEDDELNMAGGVIEEFLRYGSRVRILFTTNGDFANPGEERLKEALAAAAALGVPEEDIIFLGYSDGKDSQGRHIYNLPPDEPFVSAAGRTETYGLPDHPAYSQGVSYTRRHMAEDLERAVLEFSPDIIICAGYEKHADHCAVCLLTEEIMPGILRSRPDYRPVLLESTCYQTAYYAQKDFYNENIRSTVKPLLTENSRAQSIYRWENRVRLPVSGGGLARSIFGCSTYWQLRLHASQGAVDMAESIISGDRVFWRRDVGSLTYAAQIGASSGDASRLSDFKLLDSDNIWSPTPWDGVWTPAPGDSERRVEIILQEAADLTELRLYDNPSPEDNVLQVSVSVDGGEPVLTGSLEKDGSATVIPLSVKGARLVELRLLETEGENAGLTEIELFDGSPEPGLDFIKLMDRDGNFAYDYYIDPSGSEDFQLYLSGSAAGLTPEELNVSCVGGGCGAVIENGVVRVSCPKGRSCTVTVSSPGGELSDSVRVSNPGRFVRYVPQGFEKFMNHSVLRYLDRLNSYLLLRDVYRLARYGRTAAANQA